MRTNLPGLLVICLLYSVSLHAQTKKTPAKPIVKPPVQTPGTTIIKDTFAFNVLTTVDKILNFAEDAKKHPMMIAGDLLSTDVSGHPTYRSTIQLPGGGNAFLKPDGVKRDGERPYSSWEWQGMVYQMPKGQQSAFLKATQAKLDTLMKSFDERKKKSSVSYSIEVRCWLDKSYLDKDELSIIITFFRKPYTTEQAAIDSILQLYHPLLSDPATAGSCAQKFTGALELEGVSQSAIKEIFIGEMKDITNRNMQAGFNMLIGGPYYIDAKEAATHLSSSQQNEFKTKAKKIVDDFYEEQRKGPPKNDVVVEKKKEIEKVKAPSDPCEREKWETGVKVGQYLRANGKVSCVTDYSCTLHTYTIAWVENAKLKFSSGIKREEIKNYPLDYSYPFLLCSNCSGAGYHMEYDWYQMVVGSNYYARSDKQSKYTCGVCKGSGYMKVR